MGAPGFCRLRPRPSEFSRASVASIRRRRPPWLSAGRPGAETAVAAGEVDLDAVRRRPGETIIRPAGVEDLQYEGELAVIIGRICKQVPVERAQEVIFGYTIANDVTARDWQRSDGQWARAKGSDTFLPLGPWINTHLTLEEVGKLDIETRLNDEVRQDGSTSQMVRGVAELISYITASMTLLPGDVILTGTPAGVGAMQPGDEVKVSITGLGTLANPVADE